MGATSILDDKRSSFFNDALVGILPEVNEFIMAYIIAKRHGESEMCRSGISAFAIIPGFCSLGLDDAVIIAWPLDASHPLPAISKSSPTVSGASMK